MAYTRGVLIHLIQLLGLIMPLLKGTQGQSSSSIQISTSITPSVSSLDTSISTMISPTPFATNIVQSDSIVTHSSILSSNITATLYSSASITLSSVNLSPSSANISPTPINPSPTSVTGTVIPTDISSTILPTTFISTSPSPILTPTPTPLSTPVVTVSISPFVAYPGDIIQLECHSTLPDLVYKWIDLTSNSTLSNTSNFSYQLPLNTDHPQRMIQCQVFNSTMLSQPLANKTGIINIAYVSSVRLVTKKQDQNNLDKIEIECIATYTGVMDPSISWYFISTNGTTKIEVTTTGYLVSGRRLSIMATDPTRSGEYECRASLNDVPATIRTLSVLIQVYSAPNVSILMPSDRDVFSPLESSTFQVNCTITGLRTPTLQWLVNGGPYNATDATVHTVITQSVLNSQNLSTSLSRIESTLKFSRVGLYLESVRCTARNSLGTASREAEVRVERLGRPCAPVRLEEVESGSAWSLLEWSVNTGCADRFQFASSYRLEATASSGERRELEYFVEEEAIGAKVFRFNITGLRPNIAYQIRVSGKNMYGSSQYSDRITVVTSPVGRKVMFYYGTENGDREMEHQYLAQSPPLYLATTIPVGASKVLSVFVTPFGTINLDRRSYSWYPRSFPGKYISSLFILSPFWSDIDYSEEGNISYRVYQSGSDVVENRLTAEATRLSQEHAGAAANFTTLAVVVATWAEVVPWGYRSAPVGTNTFQAALVTDYEQTYTLFGYNCGEMAWSSSATYPTTPVIGFNAGGLLYDNNFLSKQLHSHKIGCLIQPSDPGPTVVGYKVSLDLPSEDTPESACISWFVQDTLVFSELPSLASLAPPCPCNLRQARFDALFRFDFVSFLTNTFAASATCFVSRFASFGVYQRCCYRLNTNSIFALFFSITNSPLITSGKERGSLLSTNPRFYLDSLYQRHRERDEEGYRQCCLLSDSCHVYFNRRPSSDCSGYVFTPFTWAFGDPHVITLDGLRYTFNGVGEYWHMFPIVGECDSYMQTRTALFRDTEATVFTAVTVKISNCSSVFVSLLGEDGLSLFVDNVNRTDEVRSLGELMVDDCIEIEYTNDNNTQKAHIKVVYKNGGFLNVRSDGDLISMNLSLPASCKYRTQGLLGQWDDNVNNDLLMRNGTLLSPNVTDRLKEEFAESWRVSLNESLMVYGTGDYYQYNPNYTATIFLDEIIANVSVEIQELCSGDLSCLFDAFVTNDTSIATASLSISTESQTSVQVASNMPPLVQAPPVLNLTLHNLVTYKFNVTDQDAFSVSHSLFPLLSFQQVSLSNLSHTQFQLQLKLIDIPESLNVTIIANDSLGISIRSVEVVVCHCENGGYCTPEVSPSGLSGFIRSSCQCPVAYEGLYCSSPVTDVCLQTACQFDVCPPGTSRETDSDKCLDVNECTTTCSQSHQMCTNTYGSYLCSCEAGYQMESGACVDSDECTLSISPCQHLCINTLGSYTCGCNEFYQLEPDQSSCRGIDDIQNCPIEMDPSFQCENNTCSNRDTVLVCQYCPRGTVLSSNGRECQDMDECALQSDICPPDSSICVNEYGSYSCLCYRGYTDVQDICVDVDECFSTIPVCAAGKTCFNTLGSYVCAPFCYLPNNYITPTGQCIVVERNTSRVAENTERLIITFRLTLSELSEALTARGLSISSLYSALNATLHTPREDILFLQAITSNGALQLLAISDSFQVDPSLITGLLRTDVAPDWAPYYSYVAATFVDTSSPQPDFGITIPTIIVASLCTGVFLLMLLFTISCFWALSAPKLIRRKEDDENGSLSGLLTELNKLKNKRHRPRPTGSSEFSPDWPKGIIKSDSLIPSSLSYLLAEHPPLAIFEEFDNLSMHIATVEDIPPGCEQKNRFNNILPPPHSRVPLFLKYGLPNSDYINANFVRGYDLMPRVYIATQAPLFNTEQDFWRMIWEQNTEVIVMLTEMVERGREKCIPYWPDKDILTSIRSGDIDIISKQKIVRDDYQIDEFILKHANFDEVHEVSHYWYRKWPEYGVPSDPNPLISMLLESRAKPRNSSHPVVVHCASGTGRTGVVLGVDIGMQELDETRSVDILRNMCLMRQDRVGLVQTRDQYHFLYKCVCVYARYVHKEIEGREIAKI